jgi:hypothetical protein
MILPAFFLILSDSYTSDPLSVPSDLLTHPSGFLSDPSGPAADPSVLKNVEKSSLSYFIFTCNLLRLSLHCNENAIYIFLFWELRGLSPNFHIHVSVGDLYILRIRPHIS